MSERRLSKLQRFILATAWESVRRDLEKEDGGCLRVYTDQIYNGFYRSFRSKEGDRYPHKFAVSISRALKQLEGFISGRLDCEGGTQVIVFKPKPEIAGLCRACWNEGGLKLTAPVNNKAGSK